MITVSKEYKTGKTKNSKAIEPEGVMECYLIRNQKYKSNMNDNSQPKERNPINSEKLAYWYLRLNGFLTTTNFIVHPDTGREQRTDVDILGCRFPHRSEFLQNPMIDDELFTNNNGKTFIVIAESKRSICNLNGPWTDPERENMHRVIHAIGAFPNFEIVIVANRLYESGRYENENTIISLLCFGKYRNEELNSNYIEIPQLLWEDVLSFIYNRFHQYREQKITHPQWDREGHLLWNLAIRSRNHIEFIDKIDIR